jgi:hypothetical protein
MGSGQPACCAPHCLSLRRAERAYGLFSEYGSRKQVCYADILLKLWNSYSIGVFLSSHDVCSLSCGAEQLTVKRFFHFIFTCSCSCHVHAHVQVRVHVHVHGHVHVWVQVHVHFHADVRLDGGRVVPLRNKLRIQIS